MDKRLKAIVKHSRKYDKLFSIREKDLCKAQEKRMYTDDEFMELENSLDKEGTRLRFAAGFNCLQGEAVLCKKCKHIFPAPVDEEGKVHYISHHYKCSDHENEKAFVI